jgi:hypothetical protein
MFDNPTQKSFYFQTIQAERRVRSCQKVAKLCHGLAAACAKGRPFRFDANPILA